MNSQGPINHKGLGKDEKAKGVQGKRWGPEGLCSHFEKGNPDSSAKEVAGCDLHF